VVSTVTITEKDKETMILNCVVSIDDDWEG
jgi:hypothetical protein